MHTWLATGLMGRVIRPASTLSRENRVWQRRTLAIAVVLAILAFVLPMAKAYGQAAPAQSPASAQSAPVVHEQGPARPASEAGGEANLRARITSTGHV